MTKEIDADADMSSKLSKLLFVLNKSDLPRIQEADMLVNAIKERLDGRLDKEEGSRCVPVSCNTGEGLSELEAQISKSIKSMIESPFVNAGESVLITRDRHRRHLFECVQHLDLFLGGSLPMDAAAEELRYRAV